MRKIKEPQIDLFFQYANHHLGHELKKISEILDRHPEFNELVHEDLCGTKNSNGDFGMTSEQVLRAAILKQTWQVSFERLAFSLRDSLSSRSFLFLEKDQYFGSSCLQENICKISEETWLKINSQILRDCNESGIEKARKIRIDSTVVKSNIHHPTDSVLLLDCLRVIKREFKKARKAGKSYWRLTVPYKEVKSLVFKIRNSDNDEQRKPHYKKLIKISKKTYTDLVVFLPKLEKASANNLNLVKFYNELVLIFDYLQTIIYQAEHRVINGKKVPNEKKIVSIFEPHSDIIVKDRRETYFGHKVFFTSGESNLILDCQIPRGNPRDSEMFLPSIETLSEQYGKYPRQTSADGGFASKDNVKKAKELGVTDVCFSKRCGLKITEMTKSTWVYDQLKNWRAGIEGVISYLKRGFGMDLCRWKGFDGFCKYVRSSVLAFNLTLMARHELSIE